MREINIFCFGFGQVAKNFIKKLNLENYKINLSVTSRSETLKKPLRALIITVINLMVKSLIEIY